MRNLHLRTRLGLDIVFFRIGFLADEFGVLGLVLGLGGVRETVA